MDCTNYLTRLPAEQSDSDSGGFMLVLHPVQEEFDSCAS